MSVIHKIQFKIQQTSFVTEGTGYFRPLKGANPAVGKVGKIEEVSGFKLEFVCNKSEINKIIKVIKAKHPYEEAALDIIPTIDLFKSNNQRI